jgi:mRNA interferase YafQ
MLPIRPTSRFKRDLKRAGRQGRNLPKLKGVLETLAIPEALPAEFKDHKLKGEWRDFRECHIEPDWLLIYSITDFELRPARTGSHAELFE